MEIREQVLSLFFGRIKKAMEMADLDYGLLREIRLRAGQPVILQTGEGMLYLSGKGLRPDIASDILYPDLRELSGIIESACGYSGYAFEEEIRKGYVTVPGGHRIGLAGQVVLNRDGIQTIKYISSLNIRISHSVTGCAEPWKKYFYEGNKPCHVLIVSPPGCGKTTLLRDVIRIYSQGSKEFSPVTVGVVDERSEIAGSYRGVPSHDLGMHTDVLDGCPKTAGMEMLLRSMAPEVLAIDEIGAEDVNAVEKALRCGCTILATLHGENIKEFMEKPGFQALVREKVFQRYVFLKTAKKPGMAHCIYGKNFEKLWEERSCT